MKNRFKDALFFLQNKFYDHFFEQMGKKIIFKSTGIGCIFKFLYVNSFIINLLDLLSK